MEIFAPVQKVKRLLCISPRGPLRGLEQCGALRSWDVCTVATLHEATQVLKEQRFLVGLLLDCIGHHGAHELNAFLGRHCGTQWVGVVDRAVLELAQWRSIMADHLCDFHTAPVDPERLLHTLGHVHGWAALRQRPTPQLSGPMRRTISGDSPAIRRLRSQIGRVASVTAPVLICGESGSGKELVAKAIHDESPNRCGPFVAINCGAFPVALIQSELFGHEKGAFTGAGRDKCGLIESAQGGTIFLDEIAEIPLEAQANLLRFLQERTIYRVGGTRSIMVTARVIAASHVDLQDAVACGRFREDLFYRMNVLPIAVPPLRERRADLPALVEEFFIAFSGEKNAQVRGFSAAALDAIEQHSWPGNVRELMNRIRRAMVLAEGKLISVEDLGLAAPPPTRSADGLHDSRGAAERETIRACLRRAGGNVSQAARELKVSRMTLYRLMAKHQLGADLSRC